MTAPTDVFMTALTKSLSDHNFRGLVVSQPARDATGECQAELPRKYKVRVIELKQGLRLQWEAHFATSTNHENLTADESIARLQLFFPDRFQDVYLFTDCEQLNLRNTEKGIILHRKSVEPVGDLLTSHSRQKNYLIPDGKPCPFLISLGIMTSDGKVRNSRQKKFRQVNRYLEIINDVYPQLPSIGTLRVVDFGCGLSYLTFALHHLLSEIHGRQVQLLGIDQRPDVITRCKNLASELNIHGIEFTADRIEDTSHSSEIDLAVSLHACDTATDAALAFAVQAHAKVILAAPCCQHELYSQVVNSELQLILKHGILKERFAALATDALRVAALEAVGYKTQILEFIDLEHTPKNLLIRAVRRRSNPRTTALEDYHKLQADLGLSSSAIDHILNSTNQ